MEAEVYWASCGQGLEALVADELRQVDATSVEIGHGGVAFRGREAAYRACLWSRVASRVLVQVGDGTAEDEQAFYATLHRLPWEDHILPNATFAVDVLLRQAPLNHAQYARQRVKDAVVDRLRHRFDRRPQVDRERPDLGLVIHWVGSLVRIFIDLAGGSLHRRGYRLATGTAPLRETLAASVLLRGGWEVLATEGGTLLDPMCGSGTLAIEGALIALDAAPGLLRTPVVTPGWRGIDPQRVARLTEEAHQRWHAGQKRFSGNILARDVDAASLARAKANAKRARVAQHITFAQESFDEASPVARGAGLIVCNPPYGQRLLSPGALQPLYRALGRTLRKNYTGWQASVLVPDAELGRAMGLRAERRNVVHNGPLPILNLLFDLSPNQRHPIDTPHDGSTMVCNRLRKNLKRLRPWAHQHGLECYRLYDADLPEYAVAIDRYGDHLHVQEYAPPASIPEAVSRARFRDVLDAIDSALEVPAAKVMVKVRRPQTRSQKYTKQAETAETFNVAEGPYRFMVNLRDYLDTGLFLEQRTLRKRIGERVRKGHFLNLFAYTCSASVYAAGGGAASTTSVDLSKTYLDWGRENFRVNALPLRHHRFVQADCLQWLQQPTPERYDLILLTPPTFSNSKRMRGTLDVQRDHVALITRALKLLSPGGVLLFVVHHRRFRLDHASLPKCHVNDISDATRPLDFQRSPKAYRCWEIQRSQRTTADKRESRA